MTALLKWLARVEDALLAIVLAALIGLASTQIILRNGFDTGLVWADELTRIAVLWLALLGAVAASRSDQHLRVDVLARLLPARARLAVAVLIDAFTAAICGVLAWYALGFVRVEIEFESTLLRGLPAWWFESILPLAFALMAFHQLVVMAQRLLALFRGESDDPVRVPFAEPDA